MKQQAEHSSDCVLPFRVSVRKLSSSYELKCGPKKKLRQSLKPGKAGNKVKIQMNRKENNQP